eukprot:4145344-Pyramimonas_sp.AAC.1
MSLSELESNCKKHGAPFATPKLSMCVCRRGRFLCPGGWLDGHGKKGPLEVKRRRVAASGAYAHVTHARSHTRETLPRTRQQTAQYRWSK